MNRTKFAQRKITIGSQSSIWNDQNIVVRTTETSRWMMGMQERLDVRRRARSKGRLNNKKCLKNNSLLYGQQVKLVKYGTHV